MNATSRLVATAARCMKGHATIQSTSNYLCNPLFGEATRTFMASVSASPWTSINHSSRIMFNGVSGPQQTTTTTATATTTIENSDEQRRFRSNRSRRGLYNGKDIRTGNNLSFSMKHTKRTFKPNVFVKRVYSEILDEMVRFHLTTSTLRSIDKCGGLDNYLLTSKHVTSGEGLKTKKRIISTLKYKERKARQEQQMDVGKA